MRKWIRLLIATVLMVSVAPTSFAASTTPTITVESVHAKPGKEIVLSVLIDNNPGINTFSLGFDYDESKLELLNVSLNENLGGQFVYGTKAVWLNSKDISYNGEILDLRFRVIDSATGGKTKVKATFSPGDISNYDEENVDFKSIAGVVEIDSGTTEISFLQKMLSLFNWLYEIIKEIFSLL